MRNVTNNLLPTGDIDSDELLTILLSHFGSSEGGPTSYKFPKDEKDRYLNVELYKAGNIRLINASPGVGGSEIRSIARKIAEALPPLTKVTSPIVFSENHFVAGAYRYKEVFQITPLPADAPRPPHTFGLHPFVLQFRYEGSASLDLDSIRRQRKFHELMTFLNGYLNVSITALPTYHTWVFSSRGPVNGTLQSEFLQTGYDYAFNPRDEFSPLHLHPSLPIKSLAGYYIEPDPSYQLSVHEAFSQTFDKIDELSKSDHQKLHWACSWLYIAQQTAILAPSSSFLSLVTALECLTGKPEKCPDCGQSIVEQSAFCVTCGQPRFGLTAAFRSLLEDNLPGAKERFSKEFAEMYRLRSALVHGLKGNDDIYRFSIWDDGSKMLMRLLWRFIRIALFVWLHTRT
jgi:hypothetical protein